MKDYDLVVIDNGCNRSCVIFSTNYISPVKSIEEIQTQHSHELIECREVYFDFLLSTRNSNERYAKVHCSNGVLDMTKFSYIKVSKKDSLRRISAEFYKENADRLDWTYADPLKRKLITRGLVI